MSSDPTLPSSSPPGTSPPGLSAEANRAALEAELAQLLSPLLPGGPLQPPAIDLARQATAVLYLRVSTKRQAKKGGQKEGFSIPAQRGECTRKAQSLNAAIMAEFVEKGESAKTADRPELQRLLAYIAEHSVTYVITHKLDRWARDREDDVDLEKLLRAAGVQLISVSEQYDDSPAGALFRGIMSSINEFYSRNLALEVIKGSTEKAKNGGTIGLAPIGYLNVRHMENHVEVRTVEVDPERGPLIRWAFYEYATGTWTLRSLLSELTAKGLRSVPGPEKPSKPLGTSQLHRLLHNPYYKGLVTYRGATYLGSHEPLVDVFTWNRVQALLEAQGHAGEKQRKHHHYLKGSVFCGQCGSRLIVSHNKNRHGTVYPYFVCIGRHQKRTSCAQQAMPIESVEAKVEEHYAGLGFTAERAERLRQYVELGLSSQRANAELERRHQATRIVQLTDERKKLLQAHYTGSIPLDLLKEEQDRITRELEAAKSRLAATEQAFVDIQDILGKALRLAQDCQLAYRLAGPKLRRLFNQAFFEKLLLDDEGNVASVLAEPFATLLGEELAAEADAMLVTAASGQATRNSTQTTAAAPGRDGGGHRAGQDANPGAGVNVTHLVRAVGFEPTLAGV